VAVKQHLQTFLEQLHVLALAQDVKLGDLVVVQKLLNQFRADDLAQGAQGMGGSVQTLVERHAHAQAELGVVLKQ